MTIISNFERKMQITPNYLFGLGFYSNETINSTLSHRFFTNPEKANSKTSFILKGGTNTNSFFARSIIWTKRNIVKI